MLRVTRYLCILTLHFLVSSNAVHPVFVVCTPHVVSSSSCIGLSIEEFLCTPGFVESMVENGSLCIMSALLRYIRAVWKCHGVPNYTGAMYGAFSGKLNPMCFPVVSHRLLISVFLQGLATFSSVLSLKDWTNLMCVYNLPCTTLWRLLRRCVHLPGAPQRTCTIQATSHTGYSA